MVSREAFGAQDYSGYDFNTLSDIQARLQRELAGSANASIDPRRFDLNSVTQALAPLIASRDAASKDAALRASASGNARTKAMGYFQSHGVDPTQYSGDIDTQIADALSAAPVGDTNLPSYLSGIGESLYSNAQGAARTKAMRDISSLFGPDYINTHIAPTTGSDITAGIYGKQKASADDYINNLFKRGVITSTGVAGAEKGLEDQGARVRKQLEKLRTDALATGKQSLTDIANTGKGAASTLELGQSFDPSVYGSQADQATSSFLGGLSDTLQGGVPGNLFDTSGLAALAGASQGAQNTKFDPKALAGTNVNDPLNPVNTGTGGYNLPF